MENLLQREPVWFLQWGTYFIFIFFIVILICACFFPFNEVVEGSVIVTSKNPPAYIRANQSGKIVAINYQPGDSVYEGDILGVIENSAQEGDIILLKNKISSPLSTINSLTVLSKTFPSQLEVGEIQLYYNSFLENYQRLILENSLRDDSILDSQLKNSLTNTQRTIEDKKEEFNTAKRTLDISEINYKRYQQLFKKGIVSQVDFEKAEKELLNEQQQMSFFKQQYDGLELDHKNWKSKLQLTTNTHVRNNLKLEMDLEIAKRNLIHAIDEWEEKYLLKTPITGRLSFLEIWARYQNVEKGEMIFTVVPFTRQNLIGKCKIPIRNSGKISQGQPVKVKLDNYPYQEWGILKASVGSISQVSIPGKESGFVVYLNIDNLTTNYGKELQLNQELNGKADILLGEITLMERIFYQFHHLWTNREF